MSGTRTRSPVSSPILRPLLVTIVGLIAVVLVILAGGLYQRSLLRDAFARSEASAAAQRLVSDVLEDQLDMETGIKGYAATHDKLYLSPYNDARARIGVDIDKLESAVASIDPSQLGYVRDLRATNREWSRKIAEPVMNGDFQRLRTASTHLSGEALVDRIRDDVAMTGQKMESHDRVSATETRSAIDRALSAVLFGVALVVVLGMLYAIQQARLARSAARAKADLALEREHAKEIEVLYTAEKRIATTLQDAIAQRPLPILPMLRFSATYVPASEEGNVGGDWYDAIELPNNRVLFAVGDVAGHGLGAAVAMSRARQALVTSAILDTDPATVLKRVNQELLRQRAPMVTAVTGYADAATFEFVFAVAGHPPPLLIEPGQAPRLLSCGGLPLGVMDTPEYRTYRVQTLPGSMLVLYTDGAVEHTHDVLEGERILLAAALAVRDGSGREPSTAIHSAIFAGRSAGDDVAILTVGFDLEPVTGLRVTVESAQSSIAGNLGRGRPPGTDRSESQTLHERTLS